MSYTVLAVKGNDGTTRQRRRGACVTCRKRKIRCTGERPACTECRKSAIECMYAKTKDLTEAEAEAPARSIERTKSYAHTRNGAGPPIVWTDQNGQIHERLRQACDRCRAKKNRCSGHVPECAACVELGIPCVYASDKRRRGTSNERDANPRKRRKTASPEVQRAVTTAQVPLYNPPYNPTSKPPYEPPYTPTAQFKSPGSTTRIRAPQGSTCLECRRRKRRCIGESFPCQTCQMHGIPCIPQAAGVDVVPPHTQSRAQEQPPPPPPPQQEDDPSDQLRREMDEADPVASKERPFPCLECGKRFGRREHLRRHGIIHSGQKSFVCREPGCARAFYRSDQLLRHSRTHGLNEYTAVISHTQPPNNPPNHQVRLCYGCERQFQNATAFYDHFPCVATTPGARNPQLEEETSAAMMEKRFTWCGACGRNFHDKYDLQSHLPCDRAKTDFGDFVSQLEQAASTSVTPPPPPPPP
ncbi:hypothetical protein AC579_6714 [Pseudocercospora musae]|uniref:Zn(2)-C6 fungal-type domain-containing protein n=1 Tax=Pseudocercospora musae TaxID=113226 RepID=A0A139IHK6_9PEZI|nr:hypothetical protein AC579_6714 [Pseudocercospora musae]